MLRAHFGLAALGTVLLGGTALAEPVTITFMHFNDTYEIGPVRGQGGFGELMTLIEAERAANPNTILTFGGDLLSPSVMSGLTEGAQMIELMNAIGTDVAVVGNHEFDFGPVVAAARIGESDFPWLGANMLTTDGELAVGAVSAQMFVAAGYNIGVLGVITPETATLASPGPDIVFEDPIRVAAQITAELKEQGADLIVAVTHQNLSDDEEMLRQIGDIDMVLGGHDHHPITIYQDGQMLLKAGYDAHYLAVIDLIVDRVEDDGEMVVEWRPEWRFVSTAGIEPQAGVQAIVDRWDAQLDADLAIEIGRTLVELDSRRSTVRSEESNFGNLIADAIRSATAADVGYTNGGGIRGDRTYDSGTVLTRKDVLSELPFGNVTVLIELSGADLRAALENGVSEVEDGAGRFPQVSGLIFTYDMSKPAGERVVDVTVGGEPLDPARTYTVATNDYIFGGGDGYAALTNGRALIDASGATLMASTVMNYITAQGGEVSPAVEGRITRLN